VVEHHVANVRVAGSNPVSRSNLFHDLAILADGFVRFRRSLGNRRGRNIGDSGLVRMMQRRSGARLKRDQHAGVTTSPTGPLPALARGHRSGSFPMRRNGEAGDDKSLECP
jgi:hypothetical protein